MDILLTGSVAYDYLMTFPGLFKEQILPERLASISLSFLVDSMSKQRLYYGAARRTSARKWPECSRINWLKKSIAAGRLPDSYSVRPNPQSDSARVSASADCSKARRYSARAES